MIEVELPAHLRTLARADKRVFVESELPVTIESIIDAIEEKYPMLCGTIRDRVTGARRPLVRFFVCSEDLSHSAVTAVLPEAIATGAEPFLIIGAIAGG